MEAATGKASVASLSLLVRSFSHFASSFYRVYAGHMPFQRVPNVAQFNCVLVPSTADEYINSFYVRDTVVTRNSAYLTGMAEAIGDAWEANWLPSIVNSYTFDRVDFRDLNDEFGLTGTVQYEAVGSQSTEPAPAQVSTLVQITCDAGAAPRRGRLYLVGARESVLAGATSLWDQALVDSAIASVAAVRTAISTEAITSAMVIVSRFLNNEPRTTATSNTIASISGRRLAASQRDRRPGIGS